MMKKLFIPFVILLFSCNEIPKENPTSISPVEESVLIKKDSIVSETPSRIFDSLVVCKDYGGNMEEGYTEVCDFKSKKLPEAYSYYLTTKADNAKYLEKNLPLRDTSIKQPDVSVDYKWETVSKLIMNLHFAGGETTITFEEKKGKTQVTFYSSPD